MENQKEEFSKNKIDAGRGVVQENNKTADSSISDSNSLEQVNDNERLDDRARKAGC